MNIKDKQKIKQLEQSSLKKIEPGSTSQSSQGQLNISQDTYEGFVESLKDQDSLELFKRAVNFDGLALSDKDFNQNVWTRLTFLERMVSQQIMLPQLAEIPNALIRSWTTSEQRIESV